MHGKRRRKPSRRRRWLNELNSRRVAFAVGLEREDYVFRILREAVEAGFIRDVRRTERHGVEDAKLKADIIFTDNENREHLLQVRGTEAAARGFEAEHPQVPAIAVRLTDSLETILKRLRMKFPFLRGFKLPPSGWPGHARPQPLAAAN